MSAKEIEKMDRTKTARQKWSFDRCAVIVAHPDDETLWAGGTILMHPDSQWTVVTVCRKSDPDRSAKFFQALGALNASGAMGNLDDGPEQSPLADQEVQNTILALLPSDRFDLIITHSLWGEYTKHLRHEETARAVLALYRSGRLSSNQIWMFAYEDGGGKYLPKPIEDADISVKLPEEIRQKKYDIITQTYCFGPDSFEARTTPSKEAFWYFRSGENIQKQP
jgi:LmbE family N-acetylglucosaminyl deacetylase